GVAKEVGTYSSDVGVEQITTIIEVDRRQIGVGAQPGGVNDDHLDRVRKSKEIKAGIGEFQQHKEERQINRIVSIERLDYVKGPLEKIRAFGDFLTLYPEYRGKVELINVCTPPSQGMTIYDQIRDEVNQA